jgi:hypothetical protein
MNFNKLQKNYDKIIINLLPIFLHGGVSGEAVSQTVRESERPRDRESKNHANHLISLITVQDNKKDR